MAVERLPHRPLSISTLLAPGILVGVFGMCKHVWQILLLRALMGLCGLGDLQAIIMGGLVNNELAPQGLCQDPPSFVLSLMISVLLVDDGQLAWINEWCGIKWVSCRAVGPSDLSGDGGPLSGRAIPPSWLGDLWCLHPCQCDGIRLRPRGEFDHLCRMDSRFAFD